jgi:hypothetical protein
MQQRVQQGLKHGQDLSPLCGLDPPIDASTLTFMSTIPPMNIASIRRGITKRTFRLFHLKKIPAKERLLSVLKHRCGTQFCNSILISI